MAGYFITFEGIDGSGKTTHARALAEALEGRTYSVVFTQEPGGTALGERIRDLLLDAREPLSDRAELLLFAADRAHHVDTVVRPALEAGRVVVSDRFVDSTRAYQGAGRGADRALIEAVVEAATGGLVPDRTILLDLDVAASRQRTSGGDRLEGSDDAFFDRVRQGYLALAEAEPCRVTRFDARAPRKAVRAAILDRVLRDLA